MMHCRLGALSLFFACPVVRNTAFVCQAVDNTPIPQWQRRELQRRLKGLQRTTNTIVRKLETKEVNGTQILMEAQYFQRDSRSSIVSQALATLAAKSLFPV